VPSRHASGRGPLRSRCLSWIHSRKIGGLRAYLFLKESANYAVNFEIKFAFGQLSELPGIDNYLLFWATHPR
jgi:hypothetical protein